MITRDQGIVDRRKKGLSLQEIADEFDMTRERVRQILVKQAPHLTAKEVRRIQNDRAEQDFLNRRSEIAELFQARWSEFKNMSVSEVADSTDFSESEILTMTPKMIIQILKGNEIIDHSNLLKFTETECLDAIVQAATMHYPLKMKDYVKLVGTGVIDGPSVPLLFKRFGSWTQACEAAKVEFVPALRDYDRVWSEQDLNNFVFEFVQTQLGAQDSWDDFCAWLDLKGDGYPSPATIRNRLGSWREIRSAAYSRLISEKGMEVVKW
jgi:hypothetical protein